MEAMILPAAKTPPNALPGSGSPNPDAVDAVLAAGLDADAPDTVKRAVATLLAAHGPVAAGRAAALAAVALLCGPARRPVLVGDDALPVLAVLRARDAAGGTGTLRVVVSSAAAGRALRTRLGGADAGRCEVVEVLQGDPVDALAIDAGAPPDLAERGLAAAADAVAAHGVALALLPAAADAGAVARAARLVNDHLTPAVGADWDLRCVLPGAMLLRRRERAVPAEITAPSSLTVAARPRGVGARLLHWIAGEDTAQELRLWQGRCADAQIELGRALNQANVLMLGHHALMNEAGDLRAAAARAEAALAQAAARADAAEAARDKAEADRRAAVAEAERAQARLERLQKEAAQALDAQRLAQAEAEAGMQALARRLADLSHEKIALERDLRDAERAGRPTR